MKTIKTHTDRKLEFLVVGDYGKKFVATISTQKGCPMKCKFCDCPSFGFYGNASLDDLIYETETILQTTGVNTKRFNLHFACYGGLNCLHLVLFATCGNIFGACLLKLLDG